MKTNLQIRIAEALKNISAHDLQVLAENMALLKFPNVFNQGALLVNGRNLQGQTTKGWPDAYVLTDANTAYGIEATREAQSWVRHLEQDLANAKDPKKLNLSGYFFVGGYPDHAPSAQDLKDWTKNFADLGIPPRAITLLIGRDLVAELEKPQYARIRQEILEIPSAPASFQLIGTRVLTHPKLGIFQPTQEEFEDGRVAAPSLIEDVFRDLTTNGCALVRGYGAAGKTTLAQLVSRDSRFLPHPAWYVDLARADSEDIGSTILNELVQLCGMGTLFVLDNVHLDEEFAARIVEHWRRSGQQLGSRLLMLGREVSTHAGAQLAGVPPLNLRAGFEEMRAVASRLCSRENGTVPQFATDVLQDWALTFGGSSDPKMTAVDLIAFAAAVDRQLVNIRKGNFHLTPADAVDAVRTRYLKPLNSGEYDNVLRLAALSEFEIGLYDESLVDPVGGFSVSIRELGLVVSETVGLEQRRVYTLIHAAVGKLLLEAAGRSFDLYQGRLEIASASPSIGLRMLVRDRNPDLLDAVRNGVISGKWLRHIDNLHDLANVSRVAIRDNFISSEELDDSIQKCDALRRVLSRTHSLEAINNFTSWATKLALSKAINKIGEVSLLDNSSIIKILYSSKVNSVVRFIRAHPSESAILSKIETERWVIGQRQTTPGLVSDVVAAGRYFETKGRPELAMEPAALQVRIADCSKWHRCDLSHLSHILRFADSPKGEQEHLLDALTESGWLQEACENGTLGPLCGALMSLSNYLDLDLRRFILTRQLHTRVIAELERPHSVIAKIAPRPICLLGGYANLGGQRIEAKLAWDEGEIDRMIQGLRPRNSEGKLGMYELQFWFGLKALSEAGLAPKSIAADVGDRFMRELENSAPPTEYANQGKEKLFVWLKRCRDHNWNLKF